MPLVIEDGTIVAGANSFTTDAELVAYAAARGKALPSTEAERDVLQILAVDYLTGRESQLQGTRTDNAQDLIYPRTGVYIRDALLGSNVIPKELKNAQMEASIAANSQPLNVTATMENVEEKTVGPITKTFFNGGSWATVRLDSVNIYLRPLLSQSAISGQLVRV